MQYIPPSDKQLEEWLYDYVPEMMNFMPKHVCIDYLRDMHKNVTEHVWKLVEAYNSK